MKKRIWYCVTPSFDDHGKVTAGITATQEGTSKPENSFTSTRRKDIYSDWFGSLKEAQDFIEEAKRA